MRTIAAALLLARLDRRARGAGAPPGPKAPPAPAARRRPQTPTLPGPGRAGHRGRGGDRQEGQRRSAASRRRTSPSPRTACRRPSSSFEAVELPDAAGGRRPPPPRDLDQHRPEEQRGRTFVIVFDDTHITPWKAQPGQGRGGRASSRRARARATASRSSRPPAATWWTTRMESGRAKLLDLVKRFDGRYIPDTSNERMSDYEAMRIHVYHDPDDRRAGPAALRDLRRHQHRRTEASSRAATACGPAPSTTRYVTGARVRGLLPGHHPHPRHPRGAGAGAQRPRRGEGPQVGDPRLRGLHLRHQPRRVQARQRGLAPRQRRHLLRQRARPRGHADRR